MRLLVVGHPVIVAYNQKKYVAMKQIEPELRLRIVCPKQHRHLFGTYRSEVHPQLTSDEVIPLASVFSGSHMTYALDPVRMTWILQEFRPEVIHVEEEPHAAITVATAGLRAAFAPRAAMTLFTWDNLHRRRKFPLGWLKTALRSFSLRRAEAVVCGNRDAEQLLLKQARYRGYTAVLPQFGLDPDEHAPGDEANLRQQLGLAGSIVVGFAGRLLPEKGILLLLGALAQLPELPWKLLLVGSGPLEEQIHREWMPRYPGRIVHVPAVPHREVPRYLRCLDIFVLASYAVEKWKEQFGLTLAQAMMVGVASVGSSSGAIREVLGPGGLLFEEKNSSQLERALHRLLASPELRRELGARAREFALERYALTQVAEKYLSLFEQAQRSWVSARAAPSWVASRPGIAGSAPRARPMRLRASALSSYLSNHLVNRHPRFRLFLVNLFFPDRDVDIELYGSRLRVNTRKEVGYWSAYKRVRRSIVFRDESGVLATLALLLEPSDTFVDIGANVGLFSSVVARVEQVFPQIRFYAFEPHPDTVQRLRETLKGRNVKIYNCALSDRERDLEFCETSASGSFGVKHAQSPFQIKSRTLRIKSVALDSIPIEGDSIVLKIDVESHEREVLEGARRLLSSGRVKAVYLDGYTDKSIPALLREIGFELFDGRTLSAGESDYSLLAVHCKHLERWARCLPGSARQELNQAAVVAQPRRTYHRRDTTTEGC